MNHDDYLKKFEAKIKKYEYLHAYNTKELTNLARELLKYTDDERKVTRIINALEFHNIYSVETLKSVKIERIAEFRNIGPDAVNIIRQIKNLPVLSYNDFHPFTKTYRVYFYNTEKGGSWHKDFNTLRELCEYFNTDECKTVSINYISEVKKGDNNEN